MSQIKVIGSRSKSQTRKKQPCLCILFAGGLMVYL